MPAARRLPSHAAPAVLPAVASGLVQAAAECDGSTTVERHPRPFG